MLTKTGFRQSIALMNAYTCLALRELAARVASRQTDAEAAGEKKKKRITLNPVSEIWQLFQARAENTAGVSWSTST